MSAVSPVAPARPLGLLGWLPVLWRRVLFPGAATAEGPPSRAGLLLVLLLPAVLLYPWVGFHLLEPDEGRYAQIPREMLANGPIVPTLQGQPYLDKPPLFYWLVAGSYAVFGPSASAARLMPALAVHLTILLVYLLGRRSVGGRAALWGAVLLAVSPGFASVGRLLILDGLLALWVALGQLAGLEAVRSGRLRVGWWLLAALAVALGVLTKGPIAVLLVAVPLWLHGRLSGEGAMPGWRAWLAFAGVVLAVNLPWYAAVCVARPEFGVYFFWQHNVQRFLTPFDHLQPVWYYGPILLGGLLPGTLLLVGFLRFLVSDSPTDAARRTPALGYWLLAGGWCVLFFSLSGCKLPTYILPAFPALCLAGGCYLATRPWSGGWAWRGAVGASAAVLLTAHAVGVPWYAGQRAPTACAGVLAWCADPATPVYCYPRPCDSVAFALGRSDLRSARSKHAVDLAAELLTHPRSVVLFTHRHSLAALRQTLPPGLRVAQVIDLRRPVSAWSLLDRLAGDVPWGLCDAAVIEGPAEPRPAP